MNVNELFKRKQPARRVKPGGLSQVETNRIEAEFDMLLRPIADKATQYFRSFTINEKQRSWILPNIETYMDVPIEKMVYVLKYGVFFVAEISKVELDDVNY